MAWRLATSLEVLRKQINAAYPNRDKASDGTIGDTAHANSVSDHNPNKAGVVTAFDITHDPDDGVDIAELSEKLANSRDPRIKYMIRNGQIMIPANGWYWGAYEGDPHTSHLHLSVGGNYDDETKWNIGEDMVEDNDNYYQRLNRLHRQIIGPELPRERMKEFAGRSYLEAVDLISNSPSADRNTAMADLGRVVTDQRWLQNILDLRKDVKDLKEGEQWKKVKDKVKELDSIVK